MKRFNILSFLMILLTASVLAQYQMQGYDPVSHNVYTFRNSLIKWDAINIETDFSGSLFRYEDGLGIGDNVTGYKFPTTRGLATQVMVTDGFGNISWQNQGVGSGYWQRSGTLLLPVTAGDTVGSFGDIYLNYDGPEGDSVIWFYNNGDPTEQALAWDDSSDYFLFSNDVVTKGFIYSDVYTGGVEIRSDSDIYMNYYGPDAVSNVYFHDGANPQGEYLRWDDSYAPEPLFILSDELIVRGNLSVLNDIYVNYTGTDPVSSVFFWGELPYGNRELGWDITDEMFHMDGDLLLEGSSLFVEGKVIGHASNDFECNYDGPDGDYTFWFYDGGVSKSQYIRWDDTPGRVKISCGFDVEGRDICLNSLGTEPGSAICFYSSGTPSGSYIAWSDAVGYFEVNKDILCRGYVEGLSIRADTHVYVNYDGIEGTSYLHFYDGGIPDGQSLVWDDSNDFFGFTNDLTNKGFMDADSYVRGSELRSESDLYMNYDGPDADQTIYFYNAGLTDSEWLRFQDASCEFRFSSGVMSSYFEASPSWGFYLGDMAIDGSWRLVRNGVNAEMQRREAGVWVTKFVFYP